MARSSDDAKDPTFTLGDFRFLRSERRMKIAVKYRPLVHFRQPATESVRILLVGGSLFFRKAIAKDRRIDLGEKTFVGWNMPAVKGPEMNQLAHGTSDLM